ncbi:hypothetical protein M758_8G088100 [Ceratodon purpureus]|nr:hypothetical protein M758_8G088100 [Ceratodon purpureus]
MVFPITMVSVGCLCFVLIEQVDVSSYLHLLFHCCAQA